MLKSDLVANTSEGNTGQSSVQCSLIARSRVIFHVGAWVRSLSIGMTRASFSPRENKTIYFQLNT